MEKAKDRRFSVQLACRLLGVSRSGFYDWMGRSRRPPARQQADTLLVADIRAVHDQFAMYGAPRIHRELRARGRRVGHNRVARLMRVHRIRAVRGRPKQRPRSAPARRRPEIGDRVRRQFVADAPNRIWCTDLTYVATNQGWLYVAVIIDVYSRMVVGWTCASRRDLSLAIRTLHSAIRLRRPPPGLIVHADRGNHFISWPWLQSLNAAQAQPSLGRVGTPADNAMMESWFASLKNEAIHPYPRFVTRDQARRTIFRYVIFHNNRRRHSGLDYLSPTDYESTHKTRTR